MKFTSKKSISRYITLVFVLLITAYLVYSLNQPFSDHSFFNSVYIFLFLVVVSYAIFTFFTTYYVINEHSITVRSGITTIYLNINDILMISKDKRAYSRFALSDKVINLYFKNNSFLSISPKNEELFMKTLISKNETIRVVKKVS